MPVITAWTSSLIRPNFTQRYFVFCIPAFLLVVAAGAWSVRGPFRYTPQLLLLAAIGLNLASCRNYNKNYLSQDWRNVANYIAVNQQPGDVILIGNSDGYLTETFEYYYVYKLGTPGNLPRKRIFGAVPSKEQVLDILNPARRVWLITMYDGSDYIDKYIDPKIPPEFKQTLYQRFKSTDQGDLAVSLRAK